MKRTLAAALAAASVGGTMLVATPAFAAVKPVKLTISPDEIHNGQATGITGKCLNPLARVRITSAALGVDERGPVGKEWTFEFIAGWGLNPGTYSFRAQCYTLGIPGFHTTKNLVVKHATPLIPLKPGTPVKPRPKVPGFTPDAYIQTGFGGMARSVANHHPVG
ncbi:MAG TPA: hypothetical protein VGG16_14125 [Streptosporangiaceae bacterium]|jgi:hypothetical protein